MIRYFSAICVVLLALVSFELYNGVHRVKVQVQQLASLKAEIAREAEAIRVLKAEWSSLNQPERLQDLARRHLALSPTGAAQIVVLTSLPVKGEALAPGTARIVEAAELPARVEASVPRPRPKPAIEQAP